MVRLHLKVPFNAVIPPLGLIHIIPPVKKRFPGIDIDLYDTALNSQPLSGLLKKIDSYRPDWIFFSVTYLERDMLFDIFEKLKRLFPEIILVAGGWGVSCSPAEFHRNKHLDITCAGDGEERVISVVENLIHGRTDFMDGISYKFNGEKRFSEAETLFEDLDKYGPPAWDHVKIKEYSKLPTWNAMIKSPPYAGMLTSRGCPFKCPYCWNYKGNKYRFRSTEALMEEIRLLYNKGVREIHFFDDTINIPEENSTRLLKLAHREFPDLSFAFEGMRLDYCSAEYLDMLKENGVYRIEFGVQHVAPRILEQMHRKIDLKKILKNARHLKKLGIFTHSHFIYGFPGETRKEMTMNLNFALKLDTDSVGFFKLTPYPDTYYATLKENLENIPSSEFHIFNRNEKLDLSGKHDEVVRFQYYSFRRFYIKELKIFRSFLKIPKSSYFWHTLLDPSNWIFLYK